MKPDTGMCLGRKPIKTATGNALLWKAENVIAILDLPHPLEYNMDVRWPTGALFEIKLPWLGNYTVGRFETSDF